MLVFTWLVPGKKKLHRESVLESCRGMQALAGTNLHTDEVKHHEVSERTTGKAEGWTIPEITQG